MPPYVSPNRLTSINEAEPGVRILVSRTYNAKSPAMHHAVELPFASAIKKWDPRANPTTVDVLPQQSIT